MAEAEASVRRAMELARVRQEESLELRSVMSLARLLRRKGKSEEALVSLAAVHAGLSQGFDTADLREARALLEELA
jgi:adenylate cyclase